MKSCDCLKISCNLIERGFRISVFKYKSYVVIYPKYIFHNLDLETKGLLLENFTLCRTQPLYYKDINYFLYNFTKPYLKKFIEYGIQNDLPRIAYENNVSLKELFQFSKKKKDYFSNSLRKNTLKFKETFKDHIIIAMSFGKDSLLTYGLAKELKLNCHFVYVKEMENRNSVEELYKKEILDNFSKKEKVKIDCLIDNIDNIYYDDKIKPIIKGFDNTNGMLAFALELMPFAFFYKANYIVFGNEANFSDYFLYQGFKTYPSFDQTAIYTKEKNKYLNHFTNSSVQVLSLIEQIYNIFEMSILVHRYPNLLQYLMSCSPQQESSDKWCYNCPMCAKSFLYLRAVGGKENQIGFKKNFFDKKYGNLYPLFNAKIKRTYEKPKEVRDEQLLAFLMCYQLKNNGYLINVFKKRYLKEAKKREGELRNKFLKIHKNCNIPKDIENKLVKIYSEELKKI